jgi:hypothetical protein
VKFDNRFDIVSGADSKGDVVYIDRRLPRYSRRLKTRDGKPADLWKYLGIHETYEDAAEKRGFSYSRAHEKGCHANGAQGGRSRWHKLESL